MRIRSIKPEFWKSEDVAALSWPDRLIFIGLWSYVDDNGVGRDNERLIMADLFPLEEDPRETLATISRGLQTLFRRGLIARYSVAGKPFFYVTGWPDHQKIDKPNKPRYPLPTCDDAIIRDTLATPSRDSREIPSPGAVEQRNRGTEEQGKEIPCPAEPDVVADPWLFSEFWKYYPRKVRKEAARKAWTAAMRKKADPDAIVAAADRYARDPNLPPENFIPHPATWLNSGAWQDGPLPSRHPPERAGQAGIRPSTTDLAVANAARYVEKYAAEESRLELTP